MTRQVDMTGQRFGRLVVLEHVPYRKETHGSEWVCRCDCGNVKVVTRQHLRQGTVQSCGCLRNDRIRESKRRGKEAAA